MKTKEEFLKNTDFYGNGIFDNEEIKEDVLLLMEAFANQSKWISVEDELPEGDSIKNPREIEVIGFNKSWIDPDFNPLGQRSCTYFDGGWISAKWNACHDCYISVEEDTNRDAIPTHWQPSPEPL